jgi:hypothetical protein
MSVWNLDPSDGLFVNVNGQTGEMIRDPVTGELKVVVGSNQPLGGGAGGTTIAPSSQVQGSLSGFFAGQLFGVPIWLLGLFLFLIVIGTGVRHGRK